MRYCSGGSIGQRSWQPGDFDRVVESGQAEDPIYGRTFDPKPEQEAANA